MIRVRRDRVVRQNGFRRGGGTALLKSAFSGRKTNDLFKRGLKYEKVDPVDPGDVTYRWTLGWLWAGEERKGEDRPGGNYSGRQIDPRWYPGGTGADRRNGRRGYGGQQRQNREVRNRCGAEQDKL